MVTIVKHEWHSVDSRFAFELDESILSEIYPDKDEDEISELLSQIENGEVDVEEIVNDAWENDVEIDWDRQYDDWWTERKGGYDVTYELGDEDSWHTEPGESPPTHKCTKCRWTGKSWESLTQHLREDGSVIEDYYNTDEESTSTKEVCPMCDSDLSLTEEGEKDAKERAEREARWEREAKEMEEKVPCFSCGFKHKESDLPEVNGQLYCPDCNEGWVMKDDREDDTDNLDLEGDKLDLDEALQELKDEFEKLMEESADAVVPMKCTSCEWKGDWTETSNKDIDGVDTDVCPECGSLVEDAKVEKE